MLGKIEGRRRRGLQRARWLDSIFDLMDLTLRTLQALVMDREVWHATVHVVTKSQFVSSGGQSIGASASTSVLPMNI